MRRAMFGVVVRVEHVVGRAKSVERELRGGRSVDDRDRHALVGSPVFPDREVYRAEWPVADALEQSVRPVSVGRRWRDVVGRLGHTFGDRRGGDDWRSDGPARAVMRGDESLDVGLQQRIVDARLGEE
jgi:hypothetical protein